MKKSEAYIDLHLHTKNSDGECSLDETIQAAKEAGLSAIAITDHNRVTLRSPEKHDGLLVIPGAEFSTTYLHGEGEKTEVHIVGLFFNGADPRVSEVFERINKNAYVEAILEKLDTLGIHITMEELRARNRESHQFARMQVADLIVEKGFAKDRPDAMDKWIGNFSPYYINSLDYIHYVDTEECIRWICSHGGFPIIAHPFHYRFSRPQIEEMVMRLRRATDCPMGMEVDYGKYSEEQRAYLRQLAKKYRLLSSAGSDRHRKDHPFVKGDYALLERMMESQSDE